MESTLFLQFGDIYNFCFILIGFFYIRETNLLVVMLIKILSFIFQIRGYIHQLEEKYGSFYLVVMILRVHLMNETRYDNVEGSMLFLYHEIQNSRYVKNCG